MCIAEYTQAGMAITEHIVGVPLDHSDPAGSGIELFAREVVAAGAEDAPYLLWLQGGPGNRAQRPNAAGGWLGRALRDYRVVLLDQRGTGRSTPITPRSIREIGDAIRQAEHLAMFRADSIVADAEILRRYFVGDRPWSVLGQSFGGFVATSYLSFALEGLREVFIAGGLPPLSGTAGDVYRLTYERTAANNAAYFARHPEDQRRARRIIELLVDRAVHLPAGELLTPRRFQTAGIQLGTRAGFDSLHFVLELAFADSPGWDRLSDGFLAELGGMLSYASNPLYAALHETIYCQQVASDWAAEREYARRPEFAVDAEDFLFTGEMFYPLHFREAPALLPFREAVELLAAKSDWPDLYDRDGLATNTVPVCAAVYYDDMFVAREHSLATAEAVAGLRPWITNKYMHDGIHSDGAVFDQLKSMARIG